MGSEIWWQYVYQLHKMCPLDGPDEETRFGPVCAKRAGAAAGIDEKSVGKCIMMEGSRILDSQKQDRAWSPTALRINGWRFSGPHDSEIVARAVCSAYVVEPEICDDISDEIPLQGKNVEEDYEGAASVRTIFLVFLSAVACLALVLHCHR